MYSFLVSLDKGQKKPLTLSVAAFLYLVYSELLLIYFFVSVDC